MACRAGAHSVLEAELTGYQLFDLGAYPTVLVGNSVVYGQALDYGPGINDALVVLDRLKDFHGTGTENYYNRVLTTALVLDPRADAEHLASCWLYVYNRPLGTGRLLPEAVWPAHSPPA